MKRMAITAALIAAGAALEEINPLKQRDHKSTTDVSRKLLQVMAEELRENDEPGDRSVGISANGWAELAGELELAMDGKLTCRECGGEGYVGDEAQYKNEVKRIAKETGESERDVRNAESDWLGNQTCPTCNGAGVVRMEVALQ